MAQLYKSETIYEYCNEPIKWYAIVNIGKQCYIKSSSI